MIADEEYLVFLHKYNSQVYRHTDEYVIFQLWDHGISFLCERKESGIHLTFGEVVLVGVNIKAAYELVEKGVEVLKSKV
jgi:hypothetical protein